jgi:hypothetical protein
MNKMCTIITDYTFFKLCAVDPIEKQFKFEKHHYNHFLKLNNRKKSHTLTSIKNAGYTTVYVDASFFVDYWKIFECSKWCNENLKKGSYINCQNVFCFAYEKDAIHFSIESMIFSG